MFHAALRFSEIARVLVRSDHAASFRLRLSFGFQRANDLDSRRTRDYAKRFVVHADEVLTAFMERESAVRGFLIPDVKYSLYSESCS